MILKTLKRGQGTNGGKKKAGGSDWLTGGRSSRDHNTKLEKDQEGNGPGNMF